MPEPLPGELAVLFAPRVEDVPVPAFPKKAVE